MERYEDAQIEKEQAIPARFILNRYKPNTNLSKEAKELLQETAIKVCETTINDRTAYAEAVIKGVGVYEYKDDKAKAEFVLLYNEIFSIIKAL